MSKIKQVRIVVMLIIKVKMNIKTPQRVHCSSDHHQERTTGLYTPNSEVSDMCDNNPSKKTIQVKK